MDDFATHLVGMVQAITISHSVWRGDDHALADLIVKSMENCPYESEKIRQFLYSPELQGALSTRQIAMWAGHDKLIRLVDQQSLSNRAAKAKVQHYPGDNCCRFCLLRENNRLGMELETERGLDGEFVQGSFVHPRCAAAWRRLRQQAASEAN